MLRAGLALGLLAAGTGPAFGIGFEETLRLALERAPSLDASSAREAAASQSLAGAAALPDPRLSVGIDGWPATGPDAFDLRADDMTSKQIGLEQAFPARAAREASRSVAQAELARAQALTDAERARVRQQAARAWFALWSAQARIDALGALRETARLAADTAEARLAGGTGSASEALTVQAAALALEDRIKAVTAERAFSAAALARWLDGEPDDLSASGPLPDLRRLPVSEDRLLGNLDRLAPMLPWREGERVAEAEIDAALAQKRPDYGLALRYGRRDRSPEGIARSDLVSLEFSVGLPLFSRNRQDRTIAARRAEREAVGAEFEDALREQRAALRTTLAQWHALTSRVERLETRALPLARDRSAVALAAYGAGGELAPWLEARRDEIELDIELARLRGELGAAWAALAWLLPDEEHTP